MTAVALRPFTTCPRPTASGTNCETCCVVSETWQISAFQSSQLAPVDLQRQPLAMYGLQCHRFPYSLPFLLTGTPGLDSGSAVVHHRR